MDSIVLMRCFRNGVYWLTTTERLIRSKRNDSFFSTRINEENCNCPAGLQLESGIGVRDMSVSAAKTGRPRDRQAKVS